MRFVFLALGLAVAASAFLDPSVRDAEGFLTAASCLRWSVGAALLVTGWTWPRRRAFGLWLALAILGQAAALQLVEAGPHVRYQHYRSPLRLVSELPLLTSFVVIQAGLVAFGLRRRAADVRAWMKRALRPWRWLGAAAVFFLFAATVSRQVSLYVAELLVAGFVQAVALGNILLVAASIPEDPLTRWNERLASVLTSHRRGADRVALAAAAWVTVLAAALNVVSYERFPHLQDEVAYLQHARYLANGALTMPAPPVPEAFDLYLMQFDGDRWYPAPPPGWPAVLAVGMRAGVPWLVNPVLGGLNVLLAFTLVRRLYDRRTARLAALLLAVSPWNLFLAMSYMTHTLTLTCALAGAVAIVRVRETGKSVWALAAGAAIGVASLIRPLEGVFLASLLGLWAIGAGGRRLPFVSLVLLVLSAMVVGAAVLPYNARLTGDPLRFPIMAYTDERFGPKANAYGFGPDRGMNWPIDPFPGHGPLDAMVNADLNTFALNTDLYGWATGSLVLIALAVFAGAVRRRDGPMVSVILIVFTFYFFYYFSGGPDFGARYWFLMLVPLVVLTIRGLEFLEGALGGPARGRVLPTAAALAAMALVSFVPWRGVDKYHRYLGMRPDVAELDREHGFGRSLVLVRGPDHPDYASAAFLNPLDLRDDAPVYARDVDPEVRRRVLEAYPDRSVWIVEGPSLTGDGYVVVAGPLTASDPALRDGDTP